MSANTTCDKCRYWVETGGTDAGLVGECHRHAPCPELVDAAGSGRMRCAAWPATADTNWCGDFEERPMDTREVLARVAAIEKLEAERKARQKSN